MTSAAAAVALIRLQDSSRWAWALITVIFVYTTIANIIERPEGIKIAAFFVGFIVFMSLLFRTPRSTELRIIDVVFDDAVHGFRENASRKEQELLETGGNASLSDWSKIFYLEVLDASFSIDGVLGAFAFTLSVPLILAGNGVGAIVVRYLTIRGVDEVKRYRYLKNGAMYSILVLGCIMLAEAFQIHIPEWLSPVVTFCVVGYFFAKSVRENREKAAS